MCFEWDEAKNTANIRKHGIDFADAIDIFNHPMLAILDEREDYGEERWIGDWLDPRLNRRGGLHRTTGRYDPSYLRPKSNQTRGTPL